MLLRASLCGSLKRSFCPVDVDRLLIDAMTLVLLDVLIPRGGGVFFVAGVSIQGGVGVLVECDPALRHPGRCDARVHLLRRPPGCLPKCA